MTMRRSVLFLAAAPALLVGCMPDVPGPDPEPTPRVAAVFDADTATIPLPNTAALDADGTLPKLPGAGGPDANGAFLTWLDGLHGWSEATPITIPFSGPLDESTVTTANVKMWRHEGEDAVEVELAAVRHIANDAAGSVCNPAVCGAIILAVPAETPRASTPYSVVVTKDVKGANGAEVSESSAVFFAASRSPLVTADGEITVSVLADTPATAESLEGLRQLLAPTFAAAEAAGIDRARVASAQSWSVTTDPFTILDPATSTIPIPNTLAIEADGTFPSAALTFCGGPDVDPASLNDSSCGAPAPVFHTCSVTSECDQYRQTGDPASQCVGGRCVFTNCAQGQFDSYLDQLHGWPTTTPITLPVTHALDPATLTSDSVQLWAVIDDVPTRVEGTTVAMSECGDAVTITLPAEAPAMGYATSYFAFATDDVKDEEGRALLPPAAVLLALMPHEPGELLADCAAEQAGEVCDGGGVCGGIPGVGFKCVNSLIPNASDADVASVMAIRPLFQPVVGTIDALGTKWDDLAAVWSWQTWTDTFVVFDPIAGSIPFPHTLLTTGCPNAQPICNLPDGEGPVAPLIEELKTRSGFSSTAPHWIPTLGPPLLPASVITSPQAEAGVLFAEADVIPPPLFPEAEWSVGYEFNHIVARFNRPLKPDTLVAGLTTTNLMGSNGFSAQPTPAFVFLRSQYPLVDAEGVRTIREIPNDETAAVLEASRQDFEQLFLVALLFGYGRTDINNAWAFDTGETYRPLQRLRARTLFELAAGAPVATAATPDVDTSPFANGNDTVPDPDMITVDIDVSNLEQIHWNVEFDTVYWLNADHSASATPTRSAVGVSVFIPKTGGGCSAPFNVAIAQHGHTNYRKNLGLSVANTLAADCIATVAMDMPEHGGRITGSPELHPASKPADSGEAYVTEDFVGTKNLFQQTVLDQVVMVQMIKQGTFDTALGQTFSDATSQIGYVGNSLGAFAGSLLATIEPDLGPTVLNVVGGNYGVLLKDSGTYGPLLAGAGIPPDTFAELQALHFIQWLGEVADPYAFAPYPVLNPIDELTYDGTDFVRGANLPAKDIVIQMVTGDDVVPNSTTVPLARVMGVSLADTTFPTGTPHGFLSNIDPASPVATAHDCAVQQTAEWLSTAFGGAAALTTTVTSCGL